jgi:FixJ family two-component response regulator
MGQTMVFFGPARRLGPPGIILPQGQKIKTARMRVATEPAKTAVIVPMRASGSKGVSMKDVPDAKSRIATLSRRERDVLDQLTAGHANKVVAFNLGISVRTVEVHRARMLGRLGVRRVAEAIRLWVLAGMT